MVSLRPHRIARGVALRAEMARHRGEAVHCPVCEHSFDAFKEAPDVALGLCWRCGSHGRHRAQWLFFQSRPELLGDVSSLLHLAPEWTLRRRLSALTHLRYVTADLEQPDVDLRIDLTAADLPDASFDGVICSHVLEHIADDRAAMRELCRITAPGGWCLVMVPLDLSRAETYEDPSITTPEARHRAFWRPDSRWSASSPTRRWARSAAGAVPSDTSMSCGSAGPLQTARWSAIARLRREIRSPR